MLSLGITGSLGAGKSSAADYFRQLGAEIYDADLEAKNLLLSSSELQDVVIQTFGDQVLDDTGGLDFKRLGRVAFATREEQARLNGIVHPVVVQSILEQITMAGAAAVKLFVVDAPLLFEAHLEQLLDLTLVVNSREDIRIRRAMERGNLSEDEIRERMRLQLPNAEKVTRADIVVNNNGTLEEFQAKLHKVYANLHLAD
ncbi:dephospho-CoA kinase [Candidatus Neomarinimicrobiota bacterium]